MAVCYKRQGLLTLREHMSSPSVFDGIHVPHCFSFLCCVAIFVCLSPVSCVPNVANVYGLSIPGCPLLFPLTFI